jgi:GTP-binding protein LepA
VLVRIVDGTLKKGQKIRMMGTGAAYESTASACSRRS